MLNEDKNAVLASDNPEAVAEEPQRVQEGEMKDDGSLAEVESADMQTDWTAEDEQIASEEGEESVAGAVVAGSDEFAEEPVGAEPEREKKIADYVREENFERFGVDPKRDKKKKKEKQPSVFKMLSPKFLQTTVEKYGYNFSLKRFLLFMFAAFGVALGAGWLFQLDWYFLVAIGVIAVLCVPSIFLATVRAMYASKQFHDVSDYMEQLLYSFRRKRKILTSLEDVYVAFEDDKGPMKDLVAQAIEHIRLADTDGDIHREAFDIIEKEYSNDRLRNAHNFLIAVENNGGQVENSIDLLLDERAMWDERVHVFQKEKDTIKRNITVSIVFSLILCFAILYIFSMETLAQLAIPKNLLVQTTSAAVIIMNLLLFVKVSNRFSGSWLRKEGKQSDYQILKDYFYVENYDPEKERKLSIITACCTSLIWIGGLVFDKMLITAAGALISLFCLFSSQISYSLSKKSTIKELQKAFPQWMMELALLLQSDNVQVSIAKSLDSAPVVLRPELEALVEKFEEAPHSLKPYSEFLKNYDMSDIKSTMKMLYSVSTSGTVNIEEQIVDLIKKQNNLMDKAEKITNGDQLAGMTSLNMVPMLFCIVKSVCDMTILVFSLFSLMSF